MSKSYWMREQKGNFSKEGKDTFDPRKRYVGIRLQQGVPLLDRDWNELEDIRRYEELMLRKWYVGNGTPDNGFRISAYGPPSNNFRIAAGRCIVDGFEAVNDPENEGDYLFTLDAGFEKDLNKEGIVSEELKDVFEDKRYPLSYNARIRKRKENEWVVTDKGNKRKFIVKKEEELKVYEVAKYILGEALNPPSEGVRKDTVYLDIWIEEVTSEEDPVLKNPDVNNIETCVRHKLEWCVRVYEGSKRYDKEEYHHYYNLAEIKWEDGKIKEVKDLRTIKLTLTSIKDELEYVRQATVNRWIKGGEIEYERNEKEYKSNISEMLCIISGQEIKFDEAESGGEIKEDEHFVVLARANGSKKEIEFIVTRKNLLEWLNSWTFEKWMQEKEEDYTEPILKSAFSLPLYFFETVGAKEFKKTDLRPHVVLDTWLTELAGRLDAPERRMCRVPLLQQTIFGRAVPIATVPVGGLPSGVAFDGAHIWVTIPRDDRVSKIDITTNEVVATVSVGIYPQDVAFDGTHIWVTNLKDNSVSKIDITTNKVVATVSVGRGPYGVAFDGAHIWVTIPRDDSVSKIDITTNKVVITVSVGRGPHGVAFDGAHIWVANPTDNSVSKIDITTNKVVATVSVGIHPHGVAFDGAHIWVTNIDDDSVSKIDITTNEVVATVSVGIHPHGVAFDGAHIWVTNIDDDSVSKIDITTNEVVATVSVGRGPYGVAFDGAHIWVAYPGDNSVRKILRGDLR